MRIKGKKALEARDKNKNTEEMIIFIWQVYVSGFIIVQVFGYNIQYTSWLSKVDLICWSQVEYVIEILYILTYIFNLFSLLTPSFRNIEVSSCR